LSESVNERHGDSTIYQFTLIHRVKHTFWFCIFPTLLLIVTILGACILFGLRELHWIIIAVISLVVAHTFIPVIAQLSVAPQEREPLKRAWRYPWLGISFQKSVSPRPYRRLLILLWCLPLALIAALSPWISLSWTVLLVLLHVELLWPRTVILLRFAATRRAGLIRVEDDSTSYYDP